MDKDNVFTTTWWKWTDTVIEGDSLVSKGKQEVYDPFRYQVEVPPNIVQRFLPTKRATQAKGLPYLFAVIETDQQALLWIKNFGYPQEDYPEGWLETGTGKYDLLRLKNEVKFIKILLYIIQKSKNETDIEESWQELSEQLYILGEPVRFYNRDTALGAVTDIINKYCEPMKPIFSCATHKWIYEEIKYASPVKPVFSSTTNEWVFEKIKSSSPQLPRKIFEDKIILRMEWEISSLFSTMIFMIGYDLAMFPPRKCASKTCGDFFVPNNPRNKYCSDSCKVAEQQRRHLQTPIGKAQTAIKNSRRLGKITLDQASELNKLIQRMKKSGVQHDIILNKIKEKLDGKGV